MTTSLLSRGGTFAVPEVTLHHSAPVAFVGPYELQNLLGIGATGRVWLGVHETSGQKVAIKIISKTELAIDTDLNDKVEREIAIMKLINHPHVLGLLDVYESEHNLFLILEYVAGGELFEYLAQKGRLPEEECLWYFQQIISAIDYCHHHFICHRDLKPENLLLDEHKNLKIADFGMAALQTGSDMLSQSCGSPHYASPEVIRGVPYDGKAADVWSCGVVLYALLTGSLPFDDENLQRLLTKVKIGQYKIPDYVRSEVQVLIRRILVVNPQKRYTITDIKENPWFLSNGKFERLVVPPVYNNLPPIPREALLDEDVVFSLKSLKGFDDEDSLREALAADESNVEKLMYFLLLERKVVKPAVADLVQSSPNLRYISVAGGNTIRKRTDSNVSLDAHAASSLYITRCRSQEPVSYFQVDDDNPLGLELHPSARTQSVSPDGSLSIAVPQMHYKTKPAPFPEPPIDRARYIRNRQSLRLKKIWRPDDSEESGASDSETGTSRSPSINRYEIPNSPKRSWFGNLFRQSRLTRMCESTKDRVTIEYELKNLFKLSNVEWKDEMGSFRCKQKSELLDWDADGESFVKFRVDVFTKNDDPSNPAKYSILFSHTSGSTTMFGRVTHHIINGMRVLQLRPLPTPSDEMAQ